MSTIELHEADCLNFLKSQPDDRFSLCFCSPPYEAKRRYAELGFNLQGQDWVDWCVERYVECVRVTNGLVAWVVDGGTKNFQWSATPALLMADLHRHGVKLRKPPIFHRVGICGSGGNDWWRSDYEIIICSSKGRLPWSNPTVIGKPPKYGPGGVMSHRCISDGRVGGGAANGYRDGDRAKNRQYKPPKIANPGNVLLGIPVGGGKMGNKLAHENEAPFPLELAERFVKCFADPDGIVLDCFAGSSTTGEAAVKNGRSYCGIDVRASQIELSKRRLGIE